MSSAFVGGMVAGVQSTGVKVPQFVYKGDSIVNPDTLYARLPIRAQVIHDKNSAHGSITTTNTTLTDTRMPWTTDQWVSAVVTCNSKTMTITGNTATVLTGSSWSGGGNPGNGYEWSIASVVFRLEIRRNGTPIQKSGDAVIEFMADAYEAELTGLDNFTVADGDYFDVEVTLVGLTPNEGSDLVWGVAR